MGWSGWQDPFEVRSFATSLQLRYTAGGGEAKIGSEDFESLFDFDGTFYGYDIIGYQYTIQSTWETYRTFPYPMFDMVEGVDYIEVPDQPGVFYEFEDEPNVFHGWDVPPVVLSINNDPPAERDFELLIETGTTFVVGPLDEFDPDRGAAIGGWDGATPVGTAIATPNPGMAASFSLWPSLPEFDFTVDNSYQEYLSYISAVYLIQLPRWRYWKPTNPVLRQYPRDDGKRGSPPNLAGPSSRQAGLNLAGYA